MNDCTAKIARFLASEDGPTAVEYAMVLLLVLLAVLTAINLLGQATATSFGDSGGAITQAATPPSMG